LCILYPEEGSFYTFAKPWMGHYGGLCIAFLYSTGLLIASSLLLHFAGLYCHELLPMISLDGWALIILVTMSISLLYGMHVAGFWQYILVGATVLPLLLTIVICVFHGSTSNFFPFAPYGFESIFFASKYVIFGFFGFEFSTALYNHIENPNKNVSRALTYSIMIVGSLYLLFIFSIIYGIPLSLLAQQMTISKAITLLFPQYHWISMIMHISIISATIGTIHAMMLTLTVLLRKLFAIASNNCFEQACPFKIRSKESFWIGMITIIMFILYQLCHSIEAMFTAAAISIVIPYISAMITVVLKEQRSIYKLTALLGIVTGCIIIFFTVKNL